MPLLSFLALSLPLFSLFSGAHAEVYVKAPQAAALQKIRSALKPVSGTLFSSWKSSNPCARWLGLRCDSNGNVIALVISTTNITYRSMSFNDTISYSDSLTRNGTISPEIGKLTNLQYLVLCLDQLFGEIPSSFENLKEMIYLNLGPPEYNFCKLTGPIPNAFGNLTRLEFLDLHGCNFKGVPTPKLKKLKNLTYLDLSYNNFKGNLFSFLGNFPILETLGLSGNLFWGLIPRRIGSYSKLKTLNLNGLFLRGSIPDDIYNLTSLDSLGLSFNYLTGEISPKISYLKRLKTLHISGNQIKKGFENIGSLQNLEYMSASYNKFNVNIPSTFKNLKNLQSLVCDECGLKGNTTVITMLKSLQAVSLRKNNLTGSLPDKLFLLPQPTFLDLSNNNFVGRVPKTIKIPSGIFFYTIDISNNFLTGSTNINYNSSDSESFSYISFENNYIKNYTLNNKITTLPYVNDDGNCLKNHANVTYGVQKSSKVCKNFCNAYQPGGSCGYFGVCTPTSTYAACVCNKGFYDLGNAFTCKVAPPTPPLTLVFPPFGKF